MIIRTWNEETRNGSLLDVFHKPLSGSYAALSISDNGIGMDETTQALIFDPFFTTKEVGKGTGLGLSTVYGSVSQHGGHIRLESSLGHGTTFYVYFQKSEERCVADDSKEAYKVGGGDETILVVEDNKDVLRVTVSVLEQCGYHVLRAENGNEALHMLREHDEEIGLILTDLVMPGLGGRAMAQIVRKTKPDIPILLMSAYQISADEIAAFSPGFSFIQKPFTPVALAQSIRQLLDSSERKNISQEQDESSGRGIEKRDRREGR